MMKKFVIVLAVVFFSCIGLCGEIPAWSYNAQKGSLSVSLHIRKGVYYYREGTSAALHSLSGEKVFLKEEPIFRIQKDVVSGEKVQIYPSGEIRWVFTVPEKAYPLKVSLKWQGCSDGSDGKEAVCFMPAQREEFLDLADGKLSVSKGKSNHQEEPLSGEKELLLPSFTVIRSGSGYMAPKEFLAFLKGEKEEEFPDLAGKSFLWMLLLIFTGGIALNLTPCVLPMIPINLAIIGGRDSSRLRSVLHGLTYGAGMALAYGVMGLVVVMTQSTFGALDSTWYFNGISCVIFLILGLAMFDVFTLDLSRFRGSAFTGLRSVKYAGVFLMGGLTALLAGACVAPVVVAVLIQSGKMYNSGEMGGLFLPFVLGLGMALPWPLAAAGLAVLPKPGSWMKYVKYVLGILILALGFYYGVLAWKSAFRSGGSSAGKNSVELYMQLKQVFKESSRTGKALFLDFSASWCKNCKVMESSVFTEPSIRRELEKFIFLKVDASDLKDPFVESLLQKFEVKGLPSYRILRVE